MLECAKMCEDRVAFTRHSDEDKYSEGVITEVEEDGEGGYLYKVAWDDGQFFDGRYYLPEELDEIDLDEQVALLVFGFQDILSDDDIKEWLYTPNYQLGNKLPVNVLPVRGFVFIFNVLIRDVEDYLMSDENVRSYDEF